MILHDSVQRYVFSGPRIELLEDPGGRFRIEDVSSPAFNGKFKTPHREIPVNAHSGSFYWIRFRVNDSTSSQRKFLIEFPDFRINEVRFYEKSGQGFSMQQAGDQFPFAEKEFPHKNFIFIFQPLKEGGTYYARIKASEQVGLFAEIETVQSLLHYTQDEYFFLALFYGITLVLLFFCLFIYFASKRPAYIFYGLYVLCGDIYFLTQDGLGFEYLWPTYPFLNDFAYGCAMFLMVACLLLYTRNFLSLKKRYPLLDKIILITMGIRLLAFILGFTVVPFLFYSPLMDVVPMLLAFAAGAVAWRKGYRPARFFVIAFTFLFLGFLVNVPNMTGYLVNSIFRVYSYNLGFAFQVLLFALALADKVREINRQKEAAEEKNRELDIFISKVSHDLKGPLKSIIGLTTVGQQDPKAQEAGNYFKMILSNTKRLDGILADLTHLTKVKQTRVKKEKIDFEALIKEILSSLEYYPSFYEMDFKVRVTGRHEFYGDKGLLYSVFQNMIENGIKYKKSSAPLFEGHQQRSFLKILVQKGERGVRVIFSDNGRGIPAEHLDKIFEMFFRVASDVSGTGLGLYLVKLSIEKMGGTIRVESKEGEGTTFTVELKSEA